MFGGGEEAEFELVGLFLRLLWFFKLGLLRSFICACGGFGGARGIRGGGVRGGDGAV
jgi:hypothetical protein